MTRLINIFLPKKETPVGTTLESAFSQICTTFCALDISDLWLLAVAYLGFLMLLEKRMILRFTNIFDG